MYKKSQEDPDTRYTRPFSKTKRLSYQPSCLQAIYRTPEKHPCELSVMGEILRLLLGHAYACRQPTIHLKNITYKEPQETHWFTELNPSRIISLLCRQYTI